MVIKRSPESNQTKAKKSVQDQNCFWRNRNDWDKIEVGNAND